MPEFSGGLEFRVNTTTGGDQIDPKIIALAGGGFAVVWEDTNATGGDTSSSAVRGQILDSNGAAVGPEFLINQNTAGRQYPADIAATASGGFIVTWTDDTGDGSGSAVKARIYDALGNPLGAEILVNTITGDHQWQPWIEVLPSGNFVVSWTHRSGDSSLYGVKAQIFDSTGAKLGAEFQVNTTESSYQVSYEITALVSGGFVITFDDFSHLNGDSSRYSVRGQIYDDAGNRVGGEFLVNTTTTNDQGGPYVAALAGGGFVVAWMDNSFAGTDTSGWSIRAQLFDDSGARVGGEFEVNTSTIGHQESPRIIALPSGGFMIAWRDEFGDGSGYGIRAQMFHASGARDGGELQLNDATLNDQTMAWLTETASGFAAVWADASGAGGDASGFGITGRLFTFASTINVINGTEGEDILVGTSGEDQINGFGANDVLEGRLGDDSLDGGEGFDAASYANAAGAVDVNLATGQSSGADGSDSLTGIEAVFGSAYDDVLTGDGAVNWLVGAGGNDSLYGGDGDDVLEGREGNDALDGGGGTLDIASYANASGAVNVNLATGQATGAEGTDSLVGIEQAFGSEFDDLLTGDGAANGLIGAGGNDLLFGGGGRDTLDGGEGNDTMYGEDGGDFLYGGGGDDVMAGQEGDDHFEGSAGNDQIDGGTGRNSASYFNAIGGVVVDLGIGSASEYNEDGSIILSQDSLVSIADVTGSAFDDTLIGDGGDNNLIGYVGDDLLEGRGGNDTLDGGSGTDTASYANAIGGVYVNIFDVLNAFSSGADGNDTLISVENVTGSQFDDTIHGNGLANVLSGLGGNDYIFGEGGDDTIDGGDGADTADYRGATAAIVANLTTGTASGGGGNDSLIAIEHLVGSEFADHLIGDGADNQMFAIGGDDIVEGNDGHDGLRGMAGNDSVLGGGGDDFVDGGTGDDIVDGGDGWDRAAFYSMATTGVHVDLNIQGVAQDTNQGMDTLIGIEHASGTRFDDVLIGNGGDNWLRSGVGTDSDTISGNGGNDLIEVGGGTHTLDGGAGVDTLSLFGNSTDITSDGVTFSLALQGVAQNSEQGTMTATFFENLSGSIHDDLLGGDPNANVLLGDLGSDLLYGDAGNDVLYGDGRMFVSNIQLGSGAITLYGDVDPDFGSASGNDILIGGRGDDDLYGGRGDDAMSGSQGADRFFIEAASGDDRITDFSRNFDLVVFDTSSGADEFADLTLTQVGGDTLVTWGTADSLLLEGVRPQQLDEDNFQFGAGALATTGLSAISGEQQFGWSESARGLDLF